MLITNLLYFTLSGLIGVHGTPDDPFYLSPGRSEVGRQLFGANNVGIRWTDQNKLTIEKGPYKGIRATVDPSGKYVVAIIIGDPNYPTLKNAVIFNPDGSLYRIIEPPQHIEYMTTATTYRKFPPEDFEGVKVVNNKLVIGITFNYEWFQHRVYDIEKKEWEEIITSGRY